MTITKEKLIQKDKIRNMIPYVFRGCLVRVLCSPWLGRCIGFLFQNQIPHTKGIKLLTSSKRIKPEIKASIFFRIYERSEIDQAAAFCIPEVPVIELGASIGVNTMNILKNTKSKVIAVEADSDVCEILKNNLDYNFGSDCDCKVINAAIDYRGVSEVEFTKGKDSLGGRLTEIVSKDVEIVNTSTLQEIIKLNNIENYVLVIDIEGAEASLVSNDGLALKNCYRVIGEFDGGYDGETYLSISDIIREFEKKGFVVIHKHGNRYTLENKNLKIKNTIV